MPRQTDICDDAPAGTERVVDKPKLARFLLDALQISRESEDWAAGHMAGFEGLTPRERLLADAALCAPHNPCPVEADRPKLIQARLILMNLLNSQGEAYRKDGDAILPRAYFTSTTRLVCLSSVTGHLEAVGAIADKFKIKVPIRIRSNADGLMFARTDAPYKSQEKATISFGDDAVKDKRSVKLIGVVGYPIAIKGPKDGDAYQTAEIVPYFGINRDTSKTGTDPRSVTSNNWRLGALFDYTIATANSAHYLILRPEYIFNRKEKSEVASINLTYLPFFRIPGTGLGINLYRHLIPGRDDLLSVRPLLELHFNNGTYAVKGDRPVDDAHDFSRVGGKVGVTVSSDILKLPADVTVSETYLYGLAGYPKDLDQFKAVLALGLTSDRNIGLDLSYVDGRREDLADREKGWTIGFGLKF